MRRAVKMTTNQFDLNVEYYQKLSFEYKFYRELFNQFGIKYGLPNLFDMIKNHFIVDDGYIGILSFDEEVVKFGIRVTNCEGEGTGQIVEVYFLNRSYPGTRLHISEKIKFHAIHIGDDFTFDDLKVLGYSKDEEYKFTSIAVSPKTVLRSFAQDIASLTKPIDKYTDYSKEELKAKFDKEYKQEFHQQFKKIYDDLIAIDKEMK